MVSLWWKYLSRMCVDVQRERERVDVTCVFFIQPLWQSAMVRIDTRGRIVSQRTPRNVTRNATRVVWENVKDSFGTTFDLTLMQMLRTCENVPKSFQTFVTFSKQTAITFRDEWKRCVFLCTKDVLCPDVHVCGALFTKQKGAFCGKCVSKEVTTCNSFHTHLGSDISLMFATVVGIFFSNICLTFSSGNGNSLPINWSQLSLNFATWCHWTFSFTWFFVIK